MLDRVVNVGIFMFPHFDFLCMVYHNFCCVSRDSDVVKGTPSYPHLPDHLEHQEERHCKPSWKGNAHAPAMTFAVGGRSNGGR